MRSIRLFHIGLLLCLLLIGPRASAQWALGDTLTVIQKPLVNIPSLILPGEVLTISCVADPATTGWTATLQRGALSIPLTIQSASYSSQSLWWTLNALVPDVPVFDLYDLQVTAAGGLADVTAQSVRVLPAFRDEFYFVHITDTHLPTNLYYYESGSETDSSSTVDLREITNDLNIINPEFVLLTGDLVNEGELEDYLERRYYSRAQQQLGEFDVPVFLTSGNHDLGGWSDTPPSDGTARRDWWRFFGWRRLDDPPAVAPWRTQNYSFDYGDVHFVGLESYRNYDNWRYEYYDWESFTQPQSDWLEQDLAAASASAARVLFYHFDFQDQFDLAALDVDMALWGHIHRDEGSLSSPPFDLATDQACSGGRSFRLIRYANGELDPRPTLHAGSQGQNFTTTFSPGNQGTHDQVTVVIDNNYFEAFPQGLVRVRMPAGAAGYAVTGGTLTQLDDSGAVAVCYIEVDIPADGRVVLTVEVDPTSAVDQPALARPLLLGATPNPFNPRTEIAFTLPRQTHCRLTIFDVQGRLQTVLADSTLGAGDHSYVWDGRDSEGRQLTSGIYLVSLRAEARVQTRKLVLVR